MYLSDNRSSHGRNQYTPMRTKSRDFSDHKPVYSPQNQGQRMSYLETNASSTYQQSCAPSYVPLRNPFSNSRLFFNPEELLRSPESDFKRIEADDIRERTSRMNMCLKCNLDRSKCVCEELMTARLRADQLFKEKEQLSEELRKQKEENEKNKKKLQDDLERIRQQKIRFELKNNTPGLTDEDKMLTKAITEYIEWTKEKEGLEKQLTDRMNRELIEVENLKRRSSSVNSKRKSKKQEEEPSYLKWTNVFTRKTVNWDDDFDRAHPKPIQIQGKPTMRQVKSEYVHDPNHLNIPYKNGKSINERLVAAYVKKQTTKRSLSKKLSRKASSRKSAQKQESLPMKWKDSFNAMVEDLDENRPPDLNLNKVAASSQMSNCSARCKDVILSPLKNLPTKKMSSNSQKPLDITDSSIGSKKQSKQTFLEKQITQNLAQKAQLDEKNQAIQEKLLKYLEKQAQAKTNPAKPTVKFGDKEIEAEKFLDKCTEHSKNCLDFAKEFTQ